VHFMLKEERLIISISFLKLFEERSMMGWEKVCEMS
jgi:hypothetical protein